MTYKKQKTSRLPTVILTGFLVITTLATDQQPMQQKDLHSQAIDVLCQGRFDRSSLLAEGGDYRTEEAVRAALCWLKRHQNSNGSWSCNNFFSQCDAHIGPCTNLKTNTDYLNTGGRGWKERAHLRSRPCAAG